MREPVKNIVHFHNGKGGGVLSVIKNLLRFSQDETIRNHVIITLNKKIDTHYSVPEFIGAASVQLFYYSPGWNFYYTCRQLKRLLPENAIIVAHDWLELGMVSNLGLQNLVIQFLHGDYDYYYELAKKNEAGIDAFVCISRRIQQQLTALLPKRKNDIHYLRFPVGYSKCNEKNNNVFNIVFVGRCTRDKGYHLLPGIGTSLADKAVKAIWHIVGELKETEKEAYLWGDTLSVRFYGNIPNETVEALLCEMNVIILPSIAEGMPVNIIEAMKAGVVPVVNDLPGGLEELVIEGQTGIKVAGNHPGGFVDALKSLAENIDARNQMAANARQRADQMFDPVSNTVAIEKLEDNGGLIPKNKVALKVYGSRLDQRWLGNKITFFLRNK